jgi:ribosomal protein S18 acetylase RimI-like enzyme
MTSPQQLEILDLRHFTGRQLRPLLEQEAEQWFRVLRWDYRASTELLLQYLDSRILPGFVALDRGRIVGMAFCVYEGQKAVIGDIYASIYEADSLAIVQTLTRYMLETIEASPDITRAEAQLLLFDSGVLPPIFAAEISRGVAFRTFPRLFLEHELRPGTMSAQPNPILPQLELCRWSPSFYQPSAELIQLAYAQHLDSEINDQYRTLAGSQRFLHNVVRFPGCGVFDPESSYALRERRSNRLIAVILCSRVSPDTAHITQLCIAPAYRGKHLGETLLHLVQRQLPSRSYRYITLTVSENNVSAMRLYTRSGFHTKRRFDALVLDKPARNLLPWPV